MKKVAGHAVVVVVVVVVVVFIIHIPTGTNYENHVFCYNFSCVNVCEIRICHLFYFFIRYTMDHLLRLHERITLCNCLSSSSSSLIREVGIVNRFYGFQKYCNMTDRGGEFSFLQGILGKIWYKNLYRHFYKTCDHQIWQAGTSTGFDSNKTNQASAGDVITSGSRDKLKPFPLPECLWPLNLTGW